MINKRNFFKALSAITLGTLTIGSCSNVWMMEGTKNCFERVKNAIYGTGHKKNSKTELLVNIPSLLKNSTFYKSFLVKHLRKLYTTEGLNLKSNIQQSTDYVDKQFKYFAKIFQKYLETVNSLPNNITISEFDELLSKFYSASPENRIAIDNLIGIYYTVDGIQLSDE